VAAGGAYEHPRILSAGDAALTVELGDAVDPVVNRRVLEFDRRVRAAGLPGVLESVPTYRSLFVQYDPGATGFQDLAARLLPLVPDGDVPAEGRRWVFPVCYGGTHGEDLEFVAASRPVGRAGGGTARRPITASP
jgi:allophanate hydrolase subunit 1